MNVVGNLLIRADGDSRIGTGHVMRMLALAEAWQAAGGNVTFASDNPTGNVRRRIEAAGARFLPLRSRHPHPDDLADTRAFLGERQGGSSPPMWVALDGYHFDRGYQRAIRGTETRLLVLDDAVQQHYDADVVLNQNLGVERLPHACDGNTVLLLGTRYALLRREFRRWRSFKRTIPETARRLLVTLGGADPKNVTLAVLKALGLADLPDLEARVVVGMANRNLKLLEEHVRSPAAIPPTVSVELLTNVADMAELMAWADVAVGAGGTTCWETAMAEAQALTHLGRADELSPENIADALTLLCRDRGRRCRQAEIAQGLIDGRGSERVVAVMQSLDHPLPEDGMRLRPVADDDAGPLWRLANEPSVRAGSLSPEPFSWEDHSAWYAEKRSSNDARIWVLDLHGVILGVIRYDRDGNGTAVISLHVASPFRRRGLGTRLIEETRQRVRDELAVSRLKAVVRKENGPSLNTFLKNGFTRIASETIRQRPCHILERAP